MIQKGMKLFHGVDNLLAANIQSEARTDLFGPQTTKKKQF